MPGDVCQVCGHARVFHQIGRGTGVPIGQAYCDDRHAPPCSCKGFVGPLLIFDVIDSLKELAIEKTQGRDFGDEDVQPTPGQVLTRRIDQAVDEMMAALKPFTAAGRSHVVGILLSKLS